MNKLLYGLVCLLHINWCLHEVSKCFHRDTKRETCPPFFSPSYSTFISLSGHNLYCTAAHIQGPTHPPDEYTAAIKCPTLSSHVYLHTVFAASWQLNDFDGLLLHPHEKKRVFKVSAVNNISILSFASCVALGVAMMAMPSVSLMLWSRQKYLNPWLDRH